MKTLTKEEIDQLLKEAPEWKLKDGKLTREWTFPDFVGSMKFVNKVAELAEAAGHHPDIEIHYNRVRLDLESHDAGGLTMRDRALATAINHAK